MKINLFVVSHKDVDIPSAPCLIPIRADNTVGINISGKTNYCELRALYLVWENAAPAMDDYVGFFHYRRYLETSGPVLEVNPTDRRPLPYRIRRGPDPSLYRAEIVIPVVSGFDAIAPVWEYTGQSVWARYAASHGQRGSDLALIYDLISELYPDYLSAADDYLNGMGEYYGNIFIMRGSVFCAYCDWLFRILAEFDRRTNLDCPRYTNGYLGERLFGIYFTWLRQNTHMSCGELPRIHFSRYDDKHHHFGGRQALNILFPPGSERRYRLKCFVTNFKRNTDE